jgi:hypothetical protein
MAACPKARLPFASVIASSRAVRRTEAPWTKPVFSVAPSARDFLGPVTGRLLG